MTRTNAELGKEIEEIVEVLQLLESNLSSLHLRVKSLELKTNDKHPA